MNTVYQSGWTTLFVFCLAMTCNAFFFFLIAFAAVNTCWSQEYVVVELPEKYADYSVVALDDSGSFAAIMSDNNRLFRWDLNAMEFEPFPAIDKPETDLKVAGFIGQDTLIVTWNSSEILALTIGKTEATKLERPAKDYQRVEAFKTNGHWVLGGADKESKFSFSLLLVWDLKNNKLQKYDFEGTGISHSILGVNEQGVLVGRSFYDAMIIENGKCTVFPAKQLPGTSFHTISNNGRVYGIGDENLVVWQKDKGFTKLTVGDEDSDSAFFFDVNSNEEVLGRLRSSNGQSKLSAFVWDGNEPSKSPVNVNSAVKGLPERFHIFQGISIADNGNLLVFASRGSDLKKFVLRKLPIVK